MSTVNPTFPNPELVKIEVDQFQSVSLEREKIIKMEMEMVNLVSEREWLKKEVDLLEKTQSYAELVKCSLEEKLGRSERRCEELEEKIKKIEESRIDDLELRMLKVEAALAKVLNMNLANLDNFAAAATDGIGGIGLSMKGASYQMSLRCRCTLKTIDVIKDNLHEENLEIFEQSCFGNMLKINKFKFQAHLILQLLLHMDMSASNKERLIFKINNSNLEFGPSDFFHITGLRLGKLEPTITSSSSIHKDVFQDRPFITTKNIEEAFLNTSSRHKGKGELTLKLALLYFLYGILLPRSKRKIDVQYLYLIEDLQKFNAFPWGRVAYDLLVSSILQLRLCIDGSKVTDQVASFGLYGFCHAFQAWAYEVMPSVAAYCACRVNNFENITPWILRWSATRILKSDNLKIFFPLRDKAHLNIAMGKREELSTDTLSHVATPLNTAKQKKRKLLCDKDQMPHAQPSSADTPPPPSTNASTYLSHHLARRLSQAEGMLESLLRIVDQPILDISYDELPRNEEDVSLATLTGHTTSGSNPVSVNKATEKHARAHSELANDNPETNVHLVQSKMTEMQPLVGRCPSSAAVDVITISDEDDDDDDDDDDNEVVAASDSLQSTDSDDEFLSDRYMNNFVAELKRKPEEYEY